MKINSDLITGNSNTEKYRCIYNLFIDNFNYEYHTLYSQKKFEFTQKLTQLITRKKFIEMRKKRNISNILDDKDIVIEELEDLKVNDINRYNLILETYDLIKEYDNLTTKNLEEIENNKDKEYGVCFDFAKKFESVCKENNLDCLMVIGQYIGEDGIELSHAWNCLIIDGKDYYIDISSGIHIKDGTYNGNIDDYFMKTYEELEQIDAKRKSKRVIYQEELDKIEVAKLQNSKRK